jgi:N-formylglutamate amidohydrolase
MRVMRTLSFGNWIGCALYTPEPVNNLAQKTCWPTLTQAARVASIAGMDPDSTSASDSLRHEGGSIPGSPDCAAFVLQGPKPSLLPVLIAVPHAGRAYPPCLLERMRNPGFAALRLEDRYVDRLAQVVAKSTGAALLVAQAPRAMIDLNRAADDVDWDMFDQGANDRFGSHGPGRRARTGLGLIPRRLPGLGELWKRRHAADELATRIATIHTPYHTCLDVTLQDLRERWGAALLLDLHSMPPLPQRSSLPAPQFVLGDRFGAACDGRLVGSVFKHLAQCGRSAAHNRPYAGGYVLERHAAPGAGVHALQLEIDRSCYLDARLAEPGPGFDSVVDLLAGLVRRLAAEVAEIGRTGTGAGWAEAAE